MNHDAYGEGQRLIPSFWTGFLMGLSAPALILVAMTKRDLPSVQKTLANDWHQIGEDMKVAIRKVAASKKAA